MPGFWITDFGYLWLKLYRSRSKDYWKRPPGWCSVLQAPDQGSHQSSVWNAAHYCAAPEQSLVPKRERRAWSFRLFRSLKPAQSRSTVRRFCIIPWIRSTCWFHEQGKDFVELLGMDTQHGDLHVTYTATSPEVVHPSHIQGHRHTRLKLFANFSRGLCRGTSWRPGLWPDLAGARDQLLWPLRHWNIL